MERAVQLALVGGFVAKKVAWCQVLCASRTLGFSFDFFHLIFPTL